LQCYIIYKGSMSNPYFQFKRFTVWHDRCAMKVGTDGVLLGAWTDVSHAHNVLDVGTGTGLVALMLAQRSDAKFDAIDLDQDACIQAESNVQASPFIGRITVRCIPFENYTESCDTKYDLIVSNPPYFADSLKCPDRQRAAARHNDTLPLLQLLEGSHRLLTEEGTLALILPYDRKNELEFCMVKCGFSYRRLTEVITVEGSNPRRILVEIGMKRTEPKIDRLVIERPRGSYTPEFVQLMKEYYLKM
jgi:tRNA1Val (adenine37-N6)-methyltransferase